jgi:L-fucose mutarotase
VLKNIDPVLRGTLLKSLDDLGHGQELALVDRNFPAYGVGVKVIDLGEIDTPRAAKAVFSVFPLDIFGDSPLTRMGIDESPGVTNSAHDRVREIANLSMGKDWQWHEVPRLDFYTRVKSVRFVLKSLDSTPYACFIFRKGVV